MAHHSTFLKSNAKNITLEHLHLKKEVRERINQLLEEFTYLDALNKVNIPVDNKILLYGHSGCGKTATAHAIALALHKALITVDLSGFVSSKLGETAKNLSELFKKASHEKAILFIDEFDFIGKLRNYDEKDSGEMKRLVNNLIQLIDNLSDNAMLICATNHAEIIDSAILRRFQIRLGYDLPSKQNLDDYYEHMLSTFPENIANVNRSYGISYAEAKDIMHQQIKANVISLEKQKKHFLFYFGSMAATGSDGHPKEIQGTKATLSGYKIKDLELNTSLELHKTKFDGNHAIVRSNEPFDKIEGVLVEITGEALANHNRLGPKNSKRILATVDSGVEVWINLANPH